MPELETPDMPPFDFVLENLKILEKQTDQTLADICEAHLVHFSIDVNPRIETVRFEQVYEYYRVDPNYAEYLAIGAAGEPLYRALVLRICSANIWCGQPVPQAFRARCTNLLEGEEKCRFKKPGALEGAAFMRMVIAIYFVDLVADAYGIFRTRGAASPANSAADVVADAMSEMMVECSFENVRDWCNSRKHMRMREAARWLIGHCTDVELMKIGALRRDPKWNVGPYGQLID